MFIDFLINQKRDEDLYIQNRLAFQDSLTHRVFADGVRGLQKTPINFAHSFEKWWLQLSWLEHWIVVPGVVGSNPISHPKIKFYTKPRTNVWGF